MPIPCRKRLETKNQFFMPQQVRHANYSVYPSLLKAWTLLKWWRFHMSEIISSGTYTQTKKIFHYVKENAYI